MQTGQRSNCCQPTRMQEWTTEDWGSLSRASRKRVLRKPRHPILTMTNINTQLQLARLSTHGIMKDYICHAFALAPFMKL
jgi:hypothetical protein